MKRFDTEGPPGFDTEAPPRSSTLRLPCVVAIGAIFRGNVALTAFLYSFTVFLTYLASTKMADTSLDRSSESSLMSIMHLGGL